MFPWLHSKRIGKQGNKRMLCGLQERENVKGHPNMAQSASVAVLNDFKELFDFNGCTMHLGLDVQLTSTFPTRNVWTNTNFLVYWQKNCKKDTAPNPLCVIAFLSRFCFFQSPICLRDKPIITSVKPSRNRIFRWKATPGEFLERCTALHGSSRQRLWKCRSQPGGETRMYLFCVFSLSRSAFS